MSVLTHARGRAVVTPLPQNVCGFNAETFGGKVTPWDAAIDWPTTPIKSGTRKFTWNISWGPHFSDSEEFRYWITKPDFQFQIGKPLAWSDFEEQPFCVQKYDDANPNANPAVTTDKAATQFFTTCNVPARQGRQVIYGEWGRNQFTLERFHSCMDVVFDGSGGGQGDVKSVITTQPVIATDFTGAGSVLLDGRGSTGATNLIYKWMVTAPNAALYTLDTPNASTTNLRLGNASANQAVQVSLQVSSGTSTNTSVFTFTHKPAVVASTWTDLGALSTEQRTLKVGDTVQIRAVTRVGQDVFLPTTPVTITAATTAPAAWALALAQAANAQNGGLRIGILGVNDQVTPQASATANRLYATTASNIGSAFLMVKSPTVGSGVTAVFTLNNEWNTGYCGTVLITNNTAQAVNWTTTLTVAGNVTQLWNGKWSQAGSTLTLSGPDWQPTLAAGASFNSIGFCASR
jgi:chitin-binding protein